MPKDETLDNDQDEEELDDVETGDESEDETTKDSEDAEEEDDSQDEDESDDSDDDKDSDDEDEPEFKKAFTQIKGETPLEYIPNLEEAYKQSSREAKILVKQHKEDQARIDAIGAAVAKSPELAKLINDATPNGEIPLTTDPAVSYARQEMESKMEKDYASFVELHPEVESDPALSEKLLEEVAVFGDAARKKGKILSMDEALRKAWISLGLDKDDSKDKVVTKAKETASKTSTNNTNKKSGKKPTLSQEQIEAGRKMGLTEKQMLETLSKKS